MTNKKYTNEDIISSLKIIATTRNCNECKIRNCKWGTCNCEQITANAALDLITCLQAENESLQAEIERLQKEVNLVSILFQDLQERYEEVQAKIEKLNAENMLTISERNAFRTSFYDVLKQLKIAKSEAVKEFTKRLKEFMHNKFKALDEYEFEYITERDIDNLLKETEGKV